MATQRTSIGRRLAVRRRPHRPPSRWRKPAHAPILAPRALPLFKLALGIGLGAAAALAVKEARRSKSSDGNHAGGHDGKPDRLGLRPQEPAAAGVHRMTVAQLDSAIRTLQGNAGSDPDLEVHETRKAIKRVRTLQRLRREVDSRARRDAGRALLREAAAALSAVRDTKVARASGR